MQLIMEQKEMVADTTDGMESSEGSEAQPISKKLVPSASECDIR